MVESHPRLPTTPSRCLRIRLQLSTLLRWAPCVPCHCGPCRPLGHRGGHLDVVRWCGGVSGALQDQEEEAWGAVAWRGTGSIWAVWLECGSWSSSGLYHCHAVSRFSAHRCAWSGLVAYSLVDTQCPPFLADAMCVPRLDPVLDVGSADSVLWSSITKQLALLQRSIPMTHVAVPANNNKNNNNNTAKYYHIILYKLLVKSCHPPFRVHHN